MGVFQAIGIMMMLCVVVGGVFMIIAGVNTNYQYNMAIGAHMNNAVDMIEPSGIIDELTQAKQGMIEQGLTPDLHGAMFYPAPDNSMKFQYAHIDAIIQRANDVLAWKNSTANTMQVNDVYTQKVDQLRNYITQEVRSDWIAKDTWYIKYHPVIYMSWILWLLLGGLGLMGFFFFAVNEDYLDE